MQFSEVRYQDERTKVYLGTPAVLRLSETELLATHDYFGPQLRNREDVNCLTSVYRSEDNGVTWNQITHLIGAYWGTLFQRGNEIYHLGNSHDNGDVVIRRSDDGGFTWTNPRDERSGILLRAGEGNTNPKPRYQNNNMVSFYNGRIFQSLDVQYLHPDSSGDGIMHAERYLACVLSAPEDCDLLNAANWQKSNELPFDYTKVAQIHGPNNISGWLEGNIVKTPEGKLVNFIRMQLFQPNRAAILNLSDDGRELSFDYETGIVHFLGGRSKFEIKRDAESGLYLTITSEVLGQDDTWRNFLVLAVSEDLRHWRRAKILLQDDTGLDRELSKQLTGFQYVDWQFDGDDIIYISRTAYRGAHTFHDSNRITYHVLKKYNKYIDISKK